MCMGLSLYPGQGFCLLSSCRRLRSKLTCALFLKFPSEKHILPSSSLDWHLFPDMQVHLPISKVSG